MDRRSIIKNAGLAGIRAQALPVEAKALSILFNANIANSFDRERRSKAY